MPALRALSHGLGAMVMGLKLGQRAVPISTGTAKISGAGEHVADHGGQQHANGNQASDGSGVVGVHWL